MELTRRGDTALASCVGCGLSADGYVAQAWLSMWDANLGSGINWILFADSFTTRQFCGKVTFILYPILFLRGGH